MLTGNLSGYGTMEAKAQTERCKPDYEQMIASFKSRLALNRNLSSAIFEYIGLRSVEGKLAEMIGELEYEARLIEHQIKITIENQERDS